MSVIESPYCRNNELVTETNSSIKETIISSSETKREHLRIYQWKNLLIVEIMNFMYRLNPTDLYTSQQQVSSVVWQR
jgi:hypothetical protein